MSKFSTWPSVLVSLFSGELDLDSGNVSCLAFLTQHFSPDSDFCDVKLVCKEPSAAHLNDVDSLRYHAAACFDGEFFTTAVELHYDRCYIAH